MQETFQKDDGQYCGYVTFNFVTSDVVILEEYFFALKQAIELLSGVLIISTKTP